MENDINFIKETLELAKLGSGTVSPNPLVGALIVKDGKVIGRGFHSFSGGPHAEVLAFENCNEDPAGGTLYCNLEPCCHQHKKTPPCVPLIIKKGIKRVVICNLDPNPMVNGEGLAELRRHGIETVSGILESQGKELNRFFFKYIKNLKPYISVKIAQTLDGKICLENGESKWISNLKSREIVHQMRFESDAICVGISTVINDDPFLNVRDPSGKCIKSPFKIIIGNPNKLNSKLNIFKEAPEKVIVFYNSDEILQDHVATLGAEFIKLPTENFEEKILQKLGEKKITSLFIEGGEKTISSFLKEKLVDKLIIYIAPKIFGEGKSFYRGHDTKNILDHFTLRKLQNVDGNILTEYETVR